MSEQKIVIDANLFLLFIVGKTNPNLITKRQKRLANYDITHFEILDFIVSKYSKIVVTPHILAEFWNLMGEDRGGWDIDNTNIYKTALSVIRYACEIRDPAKELIERIEIKWLGIADVSLLEAAEKQGYSLISADAKLCHQAGNLDIQTYNIWQIWDNQ